MKPSSNDTNVLQRIIEQYQLEINGTNFWVPYWINIPGALDGAYLSSPDLRGPYKGKGTPTQLRSVLLRRIQQQRLRPSTGSDYRRLMRQWGLGVDCSGFVYYVLNQFLRARGKAPLRNAIFIPKREVRVLWQKYHDQLRAGLPSRQTVENLPDPVPMAQFCRQFHKNPVHHTNVKRLVGAYSVTPVLRAEDIRPADLIKLSSKEFDHIGIVVKSTTKSVTYASSDDVRDRLGGITFHTLPITHPAVALHRQSWPDGRRYDASKRDGVWRSVLLSS